MSKPILKKIKELEESLTGYGLNDAETLNMINRLKYSIGDYKVESYLINSCGDEAGCDMCSG
jgi:hypothetical protein